MSLELLEETPAAVTPEGWLYAFRCAAEAGLVLRFFSGNREICGAGYVPRPLNEWAFEEWAASHPPAGVTFDAPLELPITGWRVTPADAPGPAVLRGEFDEPYRPNRRGYQLFMRLDVLPPAGSGGK